MTYKFYKRFPAAFLFFFIPILLLNQYGDKIDWLTKRPLLALAIGCALPIMSLSLLYFGIYARLCKIRGEQKFEGPVLWIVLGSVFTLFYFGPPISMYFLFPDVSVPPLNEATLQYLRETSVDIKQKPQERVTAAKLYYWRTRERIEYLDEIGKNRLYSPDERDKRHLRRVRAIGQYRVTRKIHAIGLISLAAISCAGFLVFIAFKKPQKRACLDQGEGVSP
jgi:hypothetical protein